jgi:hypothetical protein
MSLPGPMEIKLPLPPGFGGAELQPPPEWTVEIDCTIRRNAHGSTAGKLAFDLSWPTWPATPETASKHKALAVDFLTPLAVTYDDALEFLLAEAGTWERATNDDPALLGTWVVVEARRAGLDVSEEYKSTRWVISRGSIRLEDDNSGGQRDSSLALHRSNSTTQLGWFNQYVNIDFPVSWYHENAVVNVTPGELIAWVHREYHSVYQPGAMRTRLTLRRQP